MTTSFTLTKTQLKNGKFQYVVTDQGGNVVSKRTSNREYVACTASGQFYFGRLDLIGKCKHGEYIDYQMKNLKLTKEQYDKKNVYGGTYEQMIASSKEFLTRLNAIAYLNH